MKTTCFILKNRRFRRYTAKTAKIFFRAEKLMEVV